MDYSTSTYVRPEPPEWTLALDEGQPYIADNYSDVLPDDADEWKPSPWVEYEEDRGGWLMVRVESLARFERWEREQRRRRDVTQ